MAIVEVNSPIPYQGSKRKLAPAIARCFPRGFGRLYEPFVGSAAVTLATAAARPTARFHVNDTNGPLCELWDRIINAPDEVSSAYAKLWHEQLDSPRSFYDSKREEFNATGDPQLFLYLLARCVKAAVRYNAQGEFNQSPDNRRLGSRPERMARNILSASVLLRGRVEISNVDFRQAVESATTDDLIYMDPPYQGVSSTRDRRYVDVLAVEEFTEALAEFNDRGLSYIVSYDGRRGNRTYGKPLSPSLQLIHYEIDAGRSTQSTLSGGSDRTIESVYLSPALVARLEELPTGLDSTPDAAEMLALF
jgi:DNA adenine methylase